MWSGIVLRLRKQGGKKQPEDDLRLTAETHPLSVAYEVSCRVRAEEDCPSLLAAAFAEKGGIHPKGIGSPAPPLWEGLGLTL